MTLEDAVGALVFNNLFKQNKAPNGSCDFLLFATLFSCFRVVINKFFLLIICLYYSFCECG